MEGHSLRALPGTKASIPLPPPALGGINEATLGTFCGADEQRSGCELHFRGKKEVGGDNSISADPRK